MIWSGNSCPPPSASAGSPSPGSSSSPRFSGSKSGCAGFGAVCPPTYFHTLLVADAFFLSFAALISWYYRSAFVAAVGWVGGMTITFSLSLVPGHLGATPRPVVDAAQSPVFQAHSLIIGSALAMFTLALLCLVSLAAARVSGWFGFTRRDNPEEPSRGDFLTLRMHQFGFCLLTAGMGLLCYWEHEAWGVGWSFDRADSVILAGWCVYGAILHAGMNLRIWRIAAVPASALGFAFFSEHYALFSTALSEWIGRGL